jgi:MOSC domain-containing protein YiiM
MQGSIMGLFASPTGGVPKPFVEHLQVTVNGCIGDRQNDLKHHGGPRRAVCIMTSDVLEQLQAEGHPIDGGTTGENLLIAGIPRTILDVGAVIKTEDVTLRITGDAPPCKTIKASFVNGGFKSLSHKLEAQTTRWYAEVVKEGTLHCNEAIHIEAIN